MINGEDDTKFFEIINGIVKNLLLDINFNSAILIDGDGADCIQSNVDS